MDGIKIVVFVLLLTPCLAQEIVLKGRVIDPEGNALPDASIQLMEHKQVLSQTASGADGKFLVKVMAAGEFIIEAESSGFRPVSRPITVHPNGNSSVDIQMTELVSRIETVTVTADVNQSDVLSPDPGEKVFVRQDLLDANPGRPGAPRARPCRDGDRDPRVGVEGQVRPVLLQRAERNHQQPPRPRFHLRPERGAQRETGQLGLPVKAASSCRMPASSSAPRSVPSWSSQCS